MALTEEGALYFESLRGIPAQLRQAGERLQQRRQRPAGHIKFILPSYLGSSSITRTLLPQFMMDHPEVSLDVRLTDEGPFVVPKEFDICLMTRLPDFRLPDSRLRESKLGRLRAGIYATPTYLADYGTPQTLDDLNGHKCMSYRGRQWRLQPQGQGSTVIEIRGPLISGSNEVLKAAVLAHCGLVYSFETVFAEQLESGAVVPVLSDYTGGSGLDLRMLTPGDDYPPMRVRALAESIKSHLGPPVKP